MSGWVIERFIQSERRYWDGRGVKHENFSPEHSEAIRFSRQVDAAIVLSWLLDGIGNVVEHVWVGDETKV